MPELRAVSEPQSETEPGPFEVAATESSVRARYALKSGDTFALVDAHGDINADGTGSDGIFHADTRYLSHFRCKVMGVDLLLLGSNLAADGTYVHADLTNPDIVRDGRTVLARDEIHVERTLYVQAGVLRQRLMLTNYGQDRVDLPVTIDFDSDFADIFQVRGTPRARHGRRSFAPRGPAEVTLGYTGLDGVERVTQLSFSPPPAALSGTAALYKLTLPRGERAMLDVSVGVGGARPPRQRSFHAGLLAARKDFAQTLTWSGIVTGHATLDAALRRSAADVAMLMTKTPRGPYPYAGIPWFSTAFGRDGIITALELLWIYPQLARGVLRFLAAHQATTADAFSDAEPGKILHEMRGGEMAALKEVPFGHYYGSVDATPLFVALAGHYWLRTADDALVRELWPNIEAALAWMDTYGDRDGDGFIEYHRASDTGLVNQGWKDSGDSIFHADGTLCRGPVALVEVQGYAYEAKNLAARMARHLGLAERADALQRQADTLKQCFEAAFWSDALGSYALALDGDKRQCLVLSSNAGQVLRTGIAEDARATAVAEAMVSAEMFSGWGVRTIGQSAARYNPMSYHNGSIWPHDNALIAAGVGRYTRTGVERIFSGMLDAAASMQQSRLPELFCGFPRRRGRAPVLYPVACSPQAWASGALFHLLQSLLGLEIDGALRRVRLDRPRLPAWLPEIAIERLPVGDGHVALRLVRAETGAARVHVTANTAGFQIET